jgi:F-type H+-transporting ATPase subunit a
MSSSAELTSQEYIKHHLTNLSVGEGFWTFHIDTLGWSVFLGLVFLTIFRSVAKKVEIGVFGKL